jgi:hypothetical protein
MSSLIGIEPQALSELISAAVSKALQEQEEKAGTHRLCTSVEARSILGGISHTQMDILQKSGLLRPQTGGGKGSTRFYKYLDVMAYINRSKKKTYGID